MPSPMERSKPDYFAEDKNREVIRVNFREASYSHFFCELHKVDSVLEAVLISEAAAFEFVENFDKFHSMRDDELTEVLCTAINAYGSIATYFLDNTDDFVDLMFFRQVYIVASIKEERASISDRLRQPEPRLASSD